MTIGSAVIFALGISGAFLAALQRSTTDQAPLRPTPAGAGGEMYLNYCAPCHGRDGRGTGPVSPAFKRRATDLTLLAKRNDGKFPDQRVKATIRGDLLVVAHGSKDMPVWGPLFRYLGGGSEAEVNVRIDNLTSYIESLQQPAR